MFSPKIDWKAAVAPRVFSVWLSPAWPSSLALLATALVWSAVAARPLLTAPVVALVVDLVTSTVALVAPPTQFFTDSMMFAIFERRFVNAASSHEIYMYVPKHGAKPTRTLGGRGQVSCGWPSPAQNTACAVGYGRRYLLLTCTLVKTCSRAKMPVRRWETAWISKARISRHLRMHIRVARTATGACEGIRASARTTLFHRAISAWLSSSRVHG